jgi:RNA polymerase sigma factor for flagellar operon FliA
MPTHLLATNHTSQPPDRACEADDPLEGQTIEQVWKAYRISRSERHRTRLILHYMQHHVPRQANRVRAGLPQQVDIDDLIQVGFLGLCEAIDRFDPDRGIRFETFSTQRIRGAMRDYLRSIDPVPRLTRSRVKRFEATREGFVKCNGRAPTEEEMQGKLGLTQQRFRDLQAEVRAVAIVSYNGPKADLETPDDDHDALLGTLDASEQPLPHHEVEREDLKRWVTRGLGLRDRLIVVLYYYEALTMKEIGRTVGISESRVSQRLDTILACLRARLTRIGAEQELQV